MMSQRKALRRCDYAVPRTRCRATYPRRTCTKVVLRYFVRTVTSRRTAAATEPLANASLSQCAVLLQQFGLTV